MPWAYPALALGAWPGMWRAVARGCIGSTTCRPPSSHADTGAYQKPVHTDGSPCAQCYGLVSLEDQITEHC